MSTVFTRGNKLEKTVCHFTEYFHVEPFRVDANLPEIEIF